MSQVVHPLHKFFRPSVNSTTNCAGCGNGIVTQSILRAIVEMGMGMDDFVFVSGIGCAAWIPSPLFNADVFHSIHGRPIPFALGIKVALPGKKVIVISGDGDLAAIGGNHLIHSARRNVDMTVICVNNKIYGMTGGQAGPTTPAGIRTTTTPFGSFENPFDISRLVIAAGASFVACWTTAHSRQLTQSIVKAIDKKGFAFIEVHSQCPVQFGRKSGMSGSVQMMDDYRKRSIRVEKASGLSDEERADRIVVGELVDIEKPEMIEEIERMKTRAAGRQQ